MEVIMVWYRVRVGKGFQSTSGTPSPKNFPSTPPDKNSLSDPLHKFRAIFFLLQTKRSFFQLI